MQTPRPARRLARSGRRGADPARAGPRYAAGHRHPPRLWHARLRIAGALVTAVATMAGPGCTREPAIAPAPADVVAPAAGPAAAEGPAPGGAAVTGSVPRATGGFAAIVLLEPRPPRDFPVPADPVLMDQVALTFSPALLLVQKGRPVRFRNSEETLHNVNVTESSSGTQVFNVATPPAGWYDYAFERPGFYAVACDVHPAMAADILVTASPYAVVAGDDGRFAFAGVPPGPYDLTVLVGGRRITRAVEVAAPRTELSVEQP